nr:TetR/AcrR family transcriptional regulator [Kineosporia babensis]
MAAAQRCLNADARASMTDLATAAGVGRATLHRHFSTRDELLHELGTRSLDRWQQSMRGAGVAEAIASGQAGPIEACLRDLLSRYLADFDDFGFTLTDPYLRSAPDLMERTEQLSEEETALLAAGQRAGLLRADLDPRWLSSAVYGILVAARDAVTFGRIARRDLDEYVLVTFLEGTRAR